MGRYCIAMLLGALLFAQPLAPETLLLGRIRYYMLETLRQIPNYTCLETIERMVRHPSSKRAVLVDALRLEVAVVDGKELFSWPGERQFQERELRELAPSGAIGNGNFALHAKSVFGGSYVLFTYKGKEAQNGREIVRFDYSVPQNFSGYHIRVGDAQAVVKYHGHVLVDVDTLDLITLVVIADEDLPPELMLRRTSDTMHYARQRIGEREFLLPVSSEMIMVDQKGGENRNRVTFSACRQYSGESTLSFAEPDLSGPSPNPTVPTAAGMELPPDRGISVSLDNTYHLENGATGDLLTFTVRHDLKHRKEILLPKGAKLRMRVGAIVQRPGGGYSARLALKPVEVEFDGHAFAIRAMIEDSGSLAVGSQYKLDRAWQQRPAMIYLRAIPPHIPRGFILELRTER